MPPELMRAGVSKGRSRLRVLETLGELAGLVEPALRDRGRDHGRPGDRTGGAAKQDDVVPGRLHNSGGPTGCVRVTGKNQGRIQRVNVGGNWGVHDPTIA